MSNDIADFKNRFQILSQSFEDLTKATPSDSDITEEEKSTLARISAKMDELRKRFSAAQSTSEDTQESRNQGGKAGRKNRLGNIRSSITSLLAALKTAR